MLIFQHESQSSPPSISDNGKLRLATKSDLLLCLEDLLPLTKGANSLVPEVDMNILDGAAIVNTFKPVRSDSFADYVKEFGLHKKSVREICRKSRNLQKAYSMVSVEYVRGCKVHSTNTCPNTNSSTHRWDPSYYGEISHSDVRQTNP